MSDFIYGYLLGTFMSIVIFVAGYMIGYCFGGVRD